jgi:transcriptional regulator with XRE-family HTH domain
MIKYYLDPSDESRSYLYLNRDKSLSRCTLSGVETLAERMKWILKNCLADDGTTWTAVRLSLAAGLTQTHVGQIARGTVKNPGNDTLEAIAKTARVSYRWLGTGEGRPTDSDLISAVTQAGDRYCDLPLWERLLDTAKMLAPHIEEWVWAEVGKAKRLLDSPVTAKTLLGVARLVMEELSPPSNPPKRPGKPSVSETKHRDG